MTHVYVIQAEGGPVKVGIAVDPAKRLQALRSGTPYKLSLAHVEPIGTVNDAAAVERVTHGLLTADKVHGEWFAVSAERAREAVLSAKVDVLGPPIEAAGPSAEDHPRFRNAHGALSRFAVMALAVLPSMQQESRRRMSTRRRHKGGAPGETFQGTPHQELGRIFGISDFQLRKIIAVWQAADADPERFAHLREEMDRTGKVDGPYRRLKPVKVSRAL